MKLSSLLRSRCTILYKGRRLPEPDGEVEE
jgi:hypothetical protein